MIAFDLVDQATDGDHSFASYECQAADGSDLVELLANVIRDLYVDPERLRDVLVAAMNDAGEVADPTTINEAIRRTLTVAIPAAGSHPTPHLDVARNELAEALACLALREVHGTVIPSPRIRNKEIANQPSRGRDLVGLEDDPLVAVIGEVKASSEDMSPPRVVDSGSSSMRGQFLSFLEADDAVLTELNWMMKHAAPEHHNLIARAILAHIADDLRLCAAPVLVRPREVVGSDEFGTFKNEPGQFAPAHVRFLLVVPDAALDELAEAVYDRARR